MNATVLHVLDNTGIWFVTISIILFLLVYTKGLTDWKWSRNPVGRTIVQLDLCLLILLIPSCIRTVVGRVEFFYAPAWQYITIADVYIVGLIALSRAVIWAKMFWWDSRP